MGILGGGGGGGVVGQFAKTGDALLSGGMTGGVNPGDLLSGTSKDAGILGLGQYKANPIDINDKSFGDKASEKLQGTFAEALADAQDRQAPLAKAAKVGSAAAVNAAQAKGVTINQSPQDQFRAQQMTLAQQLAAQAAGNGPSLAQSQLRQGTERNIAGAMALAASQRGANAGQGMRQVAQQAAAANQQAAAQAADLRMQEQMAAQQQLAGVAGAARDQDIGLATSQAGLTQQTNLQNAGLSQQASLANQDATNQFKLQQAALNQQTALANQQAGLAQTGMNDQMAQFYQKGRMDMEMSDRDALMALEQLKVNQNIGISTANQKGYESAGKARGEFLGQLGEAAASAGMFSDRRLKKDVKAGDDALQAFFEKMKGKLDQAHSTAGGEEDNPRGTKTFADALADRLESGTDSGGNHAQMSDRDAKTEVEPGEDELEDLYEALDAYQYRYKNPEHGEGVHVSPMAQDLEKTKLGKSLVEETPEGKRVNYGKAAGLFMATAAMHNRRINELEEALAEALDHKSGRAA